MLNCCKKNLEWATFIICSTDGSLLQKSHLKALRKHTIDSATQLGGNKTSPGRNGIFDPINYEWFKNNI